ncbi:TfuA-like protein [Streptomyces sp. NPDC048384]|uniref:TfuA-like protein n=1 Tax=Streptomyces sp. NPDC048384 TaxID=3155487 RepID=UPI00342A0965
MAVHVFVGPSCPEPLVRERHPEVVVHGPARHGDLFPRAFRAGDVVVIVDGIYHHRLALRHKEILDALERGVTVVGAASIGALRAAELDRFGMIGVGRVYGWYREGVFDGDDAVSVAHGETGSLAGLNVPLVNLYSAVLAAQEAGILTRRAGRSLTERMEREYYPLRTRERILALARERGESAFADWYAAQLAADPAAFDQKRADALEALTLAERLGSHPHSGPPTPTGSSRPAEAPVTRRSRAAEPTPPVTTDRDWRTEYHRRWRNVFAPADPALRHRVAYQQIFTEDFPDVWWDFLHHGADAADRGFPGTFRDHILRELGPSAARWHDDPTLRTRITALLCPLPDLADSRDATLLLRQESAEDRARVTDWLERTRQHLDRHPERSLTQISEATCARLLRRIWSVHTDATLATECTRRGLPTLHGAATALRPFAIGYLSSLAAQQPVGGDVHA